MNRLRAENISKLLIPRFSLLCIISHCPLLKAAHPKKPTHVSPIPQLWGGLPVTLMSNLANGATAPHWSQHLSFFGHCLAFIPCRIGPTSPSSSCSLLRAVRSTCHGPLGGIPPLVWVALEPSPTRLPATSRGPSSHAITALPHQVSSTSLLPLLWGNKNSHTPWHDNETSSSPSHTTWCPKSTDAPWVHKTSSPRMNLSMIYMTYTQVISGHCPRVHSTNASFMIGRISPNTSCRDMARTVLSSVLLQ
jgi:hypothetical protein